MTTSRKGIRYTVTTVMLLLAVAATWFYVRSFVLHPRTRDACVRAHIIGVAPRVSGPLIEIAVTNNQLVTKGQLLLRIDPTLYALEAKTAEAEHRRSQAVLDEANAAFKRRSKLLQTGSLSVDEMQRYQAIYKEAVATESLNSAQLKEAQKKLEYTTIYAPVDGYITGMSLSPGAYASAGKPLFALIDKATLYIDAYFKETSLRHIPLGAKAEIIMMGHRDAPPLNGHVESIGFGIIPRTGNREGLLPVVDPTLAWVRLAQRFPVRITLDDPPENHPLLRVGATATVIIYEPSTEN